jgi:HJR/Mrr/RecB family endonuclease
VFENTDRTLQSAVGNYHRAKKWRIAIGIVIWVLASLVVLPFLLVRCGLGIIVAIVVVPLAAIAHFGALWTISAAFRHRYDNQDVPSKATMPKAAERLESFCDEVVHHFFARNGMIEGSSVHDLSEEELGLLADLFIRERFGRDEPANWHDFLTACSLRRDYQLFRQRIEYFRDADPVAVYASLMPQVTDGARLPFLREYLAEKGRASDPELVKSLVESHREEFKQRAFSDDLRQRRREEGFSIKIGEVDAMNPFNFEELLGMIYGAEGHQIEVTKKSGDQGADVIIERAGERCVVQAKLYSQPVGNHAVQEAVAAIRHYRCQRAIVVTNNYFTRSAVELAHSNNVSLVDRQKLTAMLDEFNKRPKDYNRLASLMVVTVRPNEKVLDALPVAESVES